MKGADFGKAIGIDRPANVKDKIKKWQTELNAEPESALDAASPAAQPKPPPSPRPPSTPKAKPLDEKPSPKPAITAAKPAEATPERPKSAKKPPPVHNPLDEEVLIATAPKKRVVSDSHWRNKNSPPKNPTSKPSPKQLPTAWVRPAARKALEKAEEEAKDKDKDKDEKQKAKPKSPPLAPNPLLIFTPRITPQAQRARAQRQRRLSRPNSAGNDERPTSSGSGSGKHPKSGDEGAVSQASPSPEKDKTEMIRVRRRPRARTSPRGSLSASEVTPVKIRTFHKSETALSEDPANLITVEYEPSESEAAVRDAIRERRRKSRRGRLSDVSGESSPDVRAAEEKRKPRRKSYHNDAQETPPRPADPVVPATPPQKLGSRLEMWLQTTPDPFDDKDSQRRRKSKESISTLELPSAGERSDVSANTDTKEPPAEEERPRTTDSRRRRKKRSSPVPIETPEKEELSVVSSIDSTEPSTVFKDSELTPTPTLKRRGARRTQHSPTKERVMSLPARELSEKDEEAASAAPSSSVDSQALDLDKVTLGAPYESPAMRRLFPSTGKRLSTIVSMDTFATNNQQAPTSDAAESELTESVVDGGMKDTTAPEVASQLRAETSTIVSRKSTKRSRLASHADLISVLSMPKAGTRSIVSARSIRTNRSRLATATIGDIMNELASDESKYMRELRTLVDGVIPVLLSCVLSKSDSAVAAGLFSKSSSTDPSDVTKPIVDMGVSLERLKTLHKRIPKEDSDAFLSWAQSAQRVYSDYIAAWRLGFQDVVISLASADEDPFKPARVVKGPEDGAPWDEGMPRNAEGYVVNGDGERVDVAYMLKRPLVRLKYLAKTIKGLNHLKPTERSEKMMAVFQELVSTARKRSNDEHARLEDEAAANIDPTRSRDPRSLAPLAGVRVDRNRCVRARDHFDLHLYHSSGQEVNCRVEVLLRDDAPGHGDSGDLLICEVGNAERWLLLPPIQLNRISARNGDREGEIIVMIRGYHAGGNEWSEVMSLTIDDEQAGFEWVQMLGLTPIPPQLSELARDILPQKTPRPTSSNASSSLVSAATGSTPPHKSRTPSPHEIEVPIGEQALVTSKRWSFDTPDRQRHSRTVSPITPPSSDVLTAAQPRPLSPSSPLGVQKRGAKATSPRREEEDPSQRTPRSLNDALQLASSGSPSSLRRAKAHRRSKTISSPSESRPSRQITLDDPIEEEPVQEMKPPRKMSKRRQSEQPHSTTSSMLSQSSKGFSVWLPTSSEIDQDYSDESEEDDHSDRSVDDDHEPPVRPLVHRRASSVPTLDMPTIPRLRKSSGPSTPVKADERSKSPEPPASAPSKFDEGRKIIDEDPAATAVDDEPPPPPPHRSKTPTTPITLKGSNTPVLTPTLGGVRNKRRSSSPLKHEYEPSTCSETSSESEEEVSETEESATSESSEDELEDDVPTPLLPLAQLPQPKQFPKVSPPGSIYTLPNGTITPSQSASNTPYRTVPQDSVQASKAIASIFTWSDAGRWDSLHPNECSIVVMPGKIEVHEISAAHSKPFLTDGDEIIPPTTKAPLIAVELTPLVPLRKSTAIDISIRSPPTAESRIKSGNNIMLRSRNAQECAQLYAMINHSRINNPTYIALQNARGPYGQSSWAEVMDRQNASRPNPGDKTSFWTGTLGRRSSYRKTTTRAASISAATESSVGTMNTALRSALGRFSFAKNGRFNIRGSTLGSRSLTSFDTGSTGSGPGSGSSTPNPGRAPGAPAGITNTKVRLYERETLTKWRDMGAARLTIMLPSLDPTASPSNPLSRSPGTRNPSQEKRIVVTGKKDQSTLLDVTLSESCFERVARSGIAVSVWEDIIGADGVAGRAAQTGGVMGSRARVFMVQMKNERECAFCFSLLGKMRY
ncbi:uncharacterized protein CC84DRAFT_201378 [Paraphaeosphaeria sporulosa]|uniref:DH domain-containing protein n=1 Tax=Paraphaeosphaeria sporulosa TaxID=1460663 RepID=A0A177C291_9PLEO|nr:uncharacterized protein CC84DRAFT_201378 [Paraphaeosphaeria sporulosa]OAG01566.1 hypothetical protein CC84DRAFT_201378 [Paraphaeosphaeria sporulosa]